VREAELSLRATEQMVARYAARLEQARQAGDGEEVARCDLLVKGVQARAARKRRALDMLRDGGGAP
jgi:hypothetical protein